MFELISLHGKYLPQVRENNFVTFTNLTILNNISLFWAQFSFTLPRLHLFAAKCTYKHRVNAIAAKCHVVLSQQISTFIHVCTYVLYVHTYVYAWALRCGLFPTTSSHTLSRCSSHSPHSEQRSSPGVN